MKIGFLVPVLMFLLATVAFAVQPQFVNFAVFKSSYTASNDSTKRIGTATFLHSVVVSSPTANGSLKIYDSRGAASNQIANVDLGAANTYEFDVVVSSGLTYTTTGNSNGVTITFR